MWMSRRPTAEELAAETKELSNILRRLNYRSVLWPKDD